jgi:hypothetical protein
MTPWTFSIKFSYGTQFTFRSLMFAAREDENLELLTRGSTPKNSAPIYGKAPYYPADPSTLGRACSGLNPYTRSYYLSAMISQGLLIVTTISQPSAGAVSSSSSGASLDQDSLKNYPEIGGNACWNPAIEDRRINMVAPAVASSQNNSSSYPTIRVSEASDA